ncbi:SLC13 family permease [Ignicoccus hospitalis]|uniref:Citrate transporter n=1 Tax=Ignicoccus hospitalis (strain KIN4/I / DSM 18386 / JCM 14125) TaxID=453591 RepID=A8AAQ9_IGNH4|nr:SLC13 family permease [Ignicoccus hospitalis]ABU82011.1 Citrate transporter [Ignicoccus hospitalis KIN4/I]HIH90968.1 hypothetical protein [Desulfurococcaceae archaeon]
MRELAAGALFAGVVTVMIFLPESKRPWAALAGAALALAAGLVEPSRLPEHLNLDVLGLIAGACVISAYLTESGLMDELAQRSLRWSKGDLRRLTWSLAMVSGVVSLFIENVTTLIMLAPMVFSVARALKVDAVPMLLAAAFASNLGGAALLVGDPQSALAAGYFNLDFGDFLFHAGKPSIFWMVLTALIASTTAFTYTFVKGKFNLPSESKEKRSIRDKKLAYVSLTALAIKILLLALRKQLGIGLSLPAFIGASIILLYTRDVKFAIKSIEWKLLAFLAGMFVLVGALQDSGTMRLVAESFTKLASCDYYKLTALIVAASVAVSAVVDNVPYLMAMFPIISKISSHCGIYYFKLLLALLIGATLGGNITYFGSSTNITAVHLLEEEGYSVRFRDFLKYGAYYTAWALGSALALYYALWR